MCWDVSLNQFTNSLIIESVPENTWKLFSYPFFALLASFQLDTLWKSTICPGFFNPFSLSKLILLTFALVNWQWCLKWFPSIRLFDKRWQKVDTSAIMPCVNDKAMVTMGALFSGDGPACRTHVCFQILMRTLNRYNTSISLTWTLTLRNGCLTLNWTIT